MDYLKGDERYLWHSNRDFNPLNFDKNILLTEAFENTFKDQYGNEYIDMLSAGGCALFSLSDVEEATKVAGEVKLGVGYFEGLRINISSTLLRIFQTFYLSGLDVSFFPILRSPQST